MTPEDLIAFEKDIAAEFEAGNIKAPVHLAGGNEKQLIDIFKRVKPDDWVLCQWRSHYHCLLKGVPAAELKAAIINGRSIALCFPEYRVVSSAIVGGIAPIAVGLAWSIKRRGGSERVWCFVGDMTGESGIYYEAEKYSRRHDLPVTWVIENNGLSVTTETQKVWGDVWSAADNFAYDIYSYKLTFPHVGTGRWVQF